MKTNRLTNTGMVVLSAALLFSCKKEAVSTNNVLSQSSNSFSSGTPSQGQTNTKYFGAPVQMGNGTTKSWLTVSKEGVPQELGIVMTKTAINNLPESHDAATFSLALPPEAKSLTPFDHIVINWNEHGHAPFFYQSPHFDFHFYMMSLAERLAIPSYADAPAGFDNNPPAGYLPPTFIAPPGGEEEQMGKHWVDANAPELPWNGGAPFTKTFIYGTYNGEVKFIEPMVTLATIQSGVASSTPFPQPALFTKQKYYPTVYNIYKDNVGQTYNITLSGFVLR
jgi:hypothetical protein